MKPCHQNQACQESFPLGRVGGRVIGATAFALLGGCASPELVPLDQSHAAVETASVGGIEVRAEVDAAGKPGDLPRSVIPAWVSVRNNRSVPVWTRRRDVRLVGEKDAGSTAASCAQPIAAGSTCGSGGVLEFQNPFPAPPEVTDAHQALVWHGEPATIGVTIARDGQVIADETISVVWQHHRDGCHDCVSATVVLQVE